MYENTVPQEKKSVFFPPWRIDHACNLYAVCPQVPVFLLFKLIHPDLNDLCFCIGR